MVDACRRASAGRITAVIPYFGYARQDRRPRATRVAITAKVVANMLARVGVHRVLTVDLHADQIQGFFDIPVDNVYASPVLLGEVWKRSTRTWWSCRRTSAAWCARAIAKRLTTRTSRSSTSAAAGERFEVMNIIGEVEGKSCVLVDDMVDTAGTLCQAAKALKDHGAKSVAAYITHPVLSGRRWSASRHRRSTNWWSRTRSRCATTRARARRSASCRWRACLRRRCAHRDEESR